MSAVEQLPRQGEVVEAKREADDIVMWSVTTILKVLSKEALIHWAVNVTAERVVAQLDTLNARRANEGPDSAVDFVKGLRWQNEGKLSDADLGTVAHGLFESYALTGIRPLVGPHLHPSFTALGTELHPADVFDLTRMVDHFDRWLQEFQPDYLATEVVVFHPEMGYAGQSDGFATVDGQRLILDYKTSRNTYDRKGNVRGPYPENALQLAAYRWAPKAAVFRARRYSNRSRRYYLLSAAEKAAAVPVPDVDGGIVIKVTPEQLGVYPVRCGPAQLDTFLFCQEVARWFYGQADHMVGNKMDPPFPRPPDTDDVFAGLPQE